MERFEARGYRPAPHPATLPPKRNGRLSVVPPPRSDAAEGAS